MFITFEGIDGSGKSTQIRKLKDRLETEGYEVEIFRDPGGTTVSEKIREILLSPESEIDPVTELLLFSAARSQLVSEHVLPLLKKGTIVILDRFYDSTTAYQGYGRKSVSLDEIEEVNKIASHLRAPDLTFYLKISLEQARERTHAKHKDRMERADDEFYRKVVEGFNQIAAGEDRIQIIDATLSAENTHNQIWQSILSHL